MSESSTGSGSERPASMLHAEAANLHAERTALVLMPFLGGTTHVWDEVRPLLGGAAVLVLDLPGFGGSSGVAGYTVTEMADAVERAITAHGVRRYVLVGHSMAGKVSAVIARRRAGDASLRGLVLVAPSPPGPEPMDDTKRHSMLGLLGTRLDDDADRARKYVAQNSDTALPEAVLARTAAGVQAMNRTAWVAWLEHGSREDWAERVGVLPQPALVLAGEKDAALGPDAQRAHTLPHLARGRVVAVAHCSHLIPLEKPELLARHLLDFLAALPEPPGLPVEYAAFLASDRVAPNTRDALQGRLHGPEQTTAIFSATELRTLYALLARIVPGTGIDLAGTIAARLATGRGDGWRYDVLPADLAAYRRGLAELGEDFADKTAEAQDEQLHRLAAHKDTSGARWFEDVRADAAEAWAAHPVSMAALGFSGPGVGGASTPHRGYVEPLANTPEPWEPRAPGLPGTETTR